MDDSTPRTGGAQYLIALLAALFTGAAFADQSIPDQYPGSLLYQKPVEVIPGVWAAIGATAPADYDNAGHNNNYVFIETGEGVVVVNSSSYLLAEALHEEIRRVTDKPVTLVINENGQGHAALGNGYWQEQGIDTLAHEDAANAFETNGAGSLVSLKRAAKERADGTAVVLPSRTFRDRVSVGSRQRPVEVIDLGHAHSPGNIVVWLPKDRLIVTGDLAFHERLLPLMEDTDTRAWLETWQAFEALEPVYVIPGHGHPTNVAQVRRYTHDYLVFLRSAIGALLDDGGDPEEAYKLDQSAWSHLDTFTELAARNAGRLFEQMEFED